MGRWEERDHTADLSIHVWGADLADLFATAARGMFALVTDLDSVPTTETHSVRLEALDVEVLLVDWLNELLYLAEKNQPAAYVQYDFDELTATSLQARVVGGPVETYHTYIKAATYHNLEVQETDVGFETEIVFDI
jgi:SHS2 domain-containing protein